MLQKRILLKYYLFYWASKLSFVWP